MTRRRWQTVAVCACAMGMACKESMVTAPVMVALFDRVFLFDSFRLAWRRRAGLYVGLAATWLLLAGLLATDPRPHSAGFSAGLSPWTYLLNQAPVITRYFELALWPRSLVLLYGWPRQVTLTDVLPEALFVLTLVALTVVALRKRPMWGFAAAWVWITLAPTSTLVPIATEVAAERRMYLPLMGLITLAVVGTVWIWTAMKAAPPLSTSRPGVAPITAALVVGGVAVGLASGTVARNEEYASPVTMARTVLERHPTSIAHLSLGRALLDAGEPIEGRQHVEAALPGVPAAHVTLGLLLLADGKTAAAMEHLQAFVRDQPAFLADAVIARAAMGQTFMDQERWPEAAEEFRTILQAVPDNLVAQRSLAEVEIAQGLWEPAVRHYRTYLTQVPNDAGSLNNLGIALGSLGAMSEARSAFEKATAADPNQASAQHNYAAVLLDELDFDQALVHARRALELEPDNAANHELFGRICLKYGRLAEAETHFARALELHPASITLRNELALLRKGHGRDSGNN
jgi:protein O-mannosyl-transferase